MHGLGAGCQKGEHAISFGLHCEADRGMGVVQGVQEIRSCSNVGHYSEGIINISAIIIRQLAF